MRASLFFRTLNHARVRHAKERHILISQICDTMTITYNEKNYETMKKHYQELAFGAPKKKALDLTDPITEHILKSAFNASLPASLRMQ